MTDNSKNYYKELTLFNDIENSSHKAWNRLNLIANLKEAGRGNDASNYLDKLSDTDKASIALMLLAIQKKGLEEVKKELNRSIA